MGTVSGVIRMGAREGQQYLPQSCPLPDSCLHSGWPWCFLSPMRGRGRLQRDCGGCRTQTKLCYQHCGGSFKLHLPQKAAKGHLVSSRYIFLLAGGCLLAGTAMGSYAVLLLIPAAGSVLVLLSVSPARAHTWVFALQMSWQTLCHLGLSRQELNLQDAR